MRILSAFIKKEFLQIIRDPSSIMIAFILPTLLSLIYMYGINMDSVNIRLGLKLDDANPQVMTLAKNPSATTTISELISTMIKMPCTMTSSIPNCRAL